MTRKNPIATCPSLGSASAAILTYNQVSTIARTLRAALSQDVRRKYQIIVADDCSTDGTTEVIQEFLDQHPGRITLLENNGNLGVGRNLLRLLRECKTDYIAICEGDDFWIRDDHIESRCSRLDAMPNSTLCFGDNVDIDLDTQLNDQHLCRWSDLGIPPAVDASFLLRRGWFIRTASFAFRSSVVGSLPRAYTELYSTDYCLHLAAALTGEVVRFDGPPSSAYVRHPGGFSRKQLTLRGALYRHFNILRVLPWALRLRPEPRLALSFLALTAKLITATPRLVYRHYRA